MRCFQRLCNRSLACEVSAHKLLRAHAIFCDSPLSKTITHYSATSSRSLFEMKCWLWGMTGNFVQGTSRGQVFSPGNVRQLTLNSLVTNYDRRRAFASRIRLSIRSWPLTQIDSAKWPRLLTSLKTSTGTKNVDAEIICRIAGLYRDRQSRIGP